MTKLANYFHTDWAAMTPVDWLGLIVTITVALLMAGAYAYAFNPANKDRFNDHRFIPLCDDRMDKED